MRNSFKICLFLSGTAAICLVAFHFNLLSRISAIKWSVDKYSLAIITFLASTIVSAGITYYFTLRQRKMDRREQIFEEVSVMIETADTLTNALIQSFGANASSESRVNLWEQYFELQKQYQGGKTRLQLLLNLYFGRDIAAHISQILNCLIHSDLNIKLASEKDKGISDNIVAFVEFWTGEATTQPISESNGYKWKMMKKCGMKVGPYIKEIVDLQKKWDEQTHKGIDGIADN